MPMKIIRKNNLETLPSDSEQIFELLSEIYGQSPWSKTFIEENMKSESSQYFLATENQVVLGFLAVQETCGELEIVNLAVRPKAQKKGIASQLLTVLEDFQGTIFLEVRQSNLPAQKLYEKFGFESYHSRKNYYTKPVEDAILMRKFQ